MKFLRGFLLCSAAAIQCFHTSKQCMLVRDFKPDNVLWDKNHPKRNDDFHMFRMADFGQCRQLPAEPKASDTQPRAPKDAVVTEGASAGLSPHTSSGTPFYHAPETVKEDAYMSCESDYYALGVSMLSLLLSFYLVWTTQRDKGPDGKQKRHEMKVSGSFEARNRNLFVDVDPIMLPCIFCGRDGTHVFSFGRRAFSKPLPRRNFHRRRTLSTI